MNYQVAEAFNKLVEIINQNNTIKNEDKNEQ